MNHFVKPHDNPTQRWLDEYYDVKDMMEKSTSWNSLRKQLAEYIYMKSADPVQNGVGFLYKRPSGTRKYLHDLMVECYKGTEWPFDLPVIG